MASEGSLYIISADRFQDSIIIGFSDGRNGRYSADLLRSVLAQSEELLEPDVLDDCEEPGAGPDPAI